MVPRELQMTKSNQRLNAYRKIGKAGLKLRRDLKETNSLTKRRRVVSTSKKERLEKSYVRATALNAMPCSSTFPQL